MQWVLNGWVEWVHWATQYYPIFNKLIHKYRNLPPHTKFTMITSKITTDTPKLKYQWHTKLTNASPNFSNITPKIISATPKLLTQYHVFLVCNHICHVWLVIQPWNWSEGQVYFYILHCQVNQWILQITSCFIFVGLLTIMFPLQISFMSLIDVRVMNNGNSDPPKASSSWVKKAPIVNEATAWSAHPSNYYKQTHAPTEGKQHCLASLLWVWFSFGG